MNDLLAVLLLSFMGSVVGLIGGVILVFKRKWANTISNFAVPFAAGVLITVSLVHLIPEAGELSGQAGFLLVLASFLASFFFEQFITRIHHHGGDKVGKGSVVLVLFGDTIHNFIDGVAIAAAYKADPAAGVAVALSTLLHEIPHEIADFGILLKAGWSRASALYANLFSALVTIAASYITFVSVSDSSENVGLLLALSAGVFLYLGATDFLPGLQKGQDKKGRRTQSINSILVILGVIIVLAFQFFIPKH